MCRLAFLIKNFARVREDECESVEGVWKVREECGGPVGEGLGLAVEALPVVPVRVCGLQHSDKALGQQCHQPLKLKHPVR